jgi:biopolymer transport protein ExbD
MKNSRRMKRMSRNKKKIQSLPLTSLMDVFTILVFFLLFHSGSSEIVEAPKQITLPDSTVEAKPRETVVILVSPEDVLVQGKAVVSTTQLLDTNTGDIPEISDRLTHLERNIIGISTKAAVDSKEVTILADKGIPFRALKRIMSTCTSSGYGKISLAVNQKDAQN